MNVEETAESKKILVSDVLSLMNYLEELMKKYPQGVTQKELAELTSVTPGAISKIKERILNFCDLEVFAYESKFVLKPDRFVFEMLFNEYWNSGQYLKLISLVSTLYAEVVIIDEGLYELATKKLPFLSICFSNQELELCIKILLRYVRSFSSSSGTHKEVEKISEIARQMDPTDNGDQFLLGFFLGKIMRKSDLDWPIENDNEMRIVIDMRDKFYYLSKDLICKFTDNLKIIDGLKTDKEKETYKKVYRETTEFYLQMIFSSITNSLEVTSKKKGIPFLDIYREIEKPPSGENQ